MLKISPPESIKIDAQILQTLMDVNRDERERVAQESENLDLKIEKIFSEIPTLLTRDTHVIPKSCVDWNPLKFVLFL